MHAMARVRIFIATNVTLYGEALQETLGEEPTFEIAGVAGSAAEAQRALLKLDADVLLLDSALPLGITLAREVFDAPRHCKVIVLGLAEVESQVLSWAEAGIESRMR